MDTYEPQMVIPTEHNIGKWKTFLPPLHIIEIGRLRNINQQFIIALEENLENGNVAQFDQISIIQGKIIFYSLFMQGVIQRIINIF